MGELIVTTFACVAVAAGGLIAWALIMNGRRQARHWDVYTEKHPPIGDEEFLRLCDAGANREIALKVRAIICDCTVIDYDRIYPNTRLMQDVW